MALEPVAVVQKLCYWCYAKHRSHTIFGLLVRASGTG
jgi:hypothetical protein